MLVHYDRVEALDRRQNQSTLRGYVLARHSASNEEALRHISLKIMLRSEQYVGFSKPLRFSPPFRCKHQVLWREAAETDRVEGRTEHYHKEVDMATASLPPCSKDESNAVWMVIVEHGGHTC
jgi:hypothetical protein